MDTTAAVDEGPDKVPAGSVDNAMRALQLLRDRGSLRVSELAKELSVARSTAHRLMMLLSAYGVVEPEPDSPRYHAARCSPSSAWRPSGHATCPSRCIPTLNASAMKWARPSIS